MEAPLKQVFLDTETTGLYANKDRIVEIAGIEVINNRETGRVFHTLVNPMREIQADAIKIHGITDEMVKGAKNFAGIAADFLKFVEGATLVIHNKSFDIAFLMAELGRVKLEKTWAGDFCTLIEAQRQFPNQSNSLDSLLARFNIDASSRTKHGALIDTKLLVQVYHRLMGLDKLDLDNRNAVVEENIASTAGTRLGAQTWFPRRPSVAIPADAMEKHIAFLKSVDNPIWQRNSDT